MLNHKGTKTIETDRLILRRFTMEDGTHQNVDMMHSEEYTYLEDDMEKADFREVLRQYKQTIDALGFEGLLKECTDHYDSFYKLGYVKTADETLNSIYKTALYSVKCNTTKASIAVGFNNGSWDGRYFAFDEYTVLDTVLQGHTTLWAVMKEKEEQQQC